jgi:hypothetical protein
MAHDPPPSKRPDNSEELGWAFNNEIGYTVIELEQLTKAKEKFEGDSSAFEQRLESLDAIKNYLHREE